MNIKLFKLTALSLMTLALGSCASKDAKASEETSENSAVETEAVVADVPTYPRGTGVIEYDSNVYGKNIRPDAELPVVIDFNATWCGPCKQFEPVFKKVAGEHQDIIFLSVDVDNNPEAAEQFEVSAIPQVTMLMPDGTTQTSVGLMDEATFLQMLGMQ
ncbi:MAG: thioredoxin family protein [Lachnoclostridium sp.]|nr:thioredoxin family protein [Lachnoclostridium sp.]